MDLGAFLDAGIKMGFLTSKIAQLEQESHDLRERVSKLPPEQQFTFALMQTRSLVRLWRTVSPEDAIKLTAGVMDITEEELREELDEALKIAREQLEGTGTL